MLGGLPWDSIAEVSFRDEWVVCEGKTEAVQAQREAWGEGEGGVGVEEGRDGGLEKPKEAIGAEQQGEKA